MTHLHKIWQDDAERLSQVHCPLKTFILKIQDGRWPERPILHHHEILQFVDFQDGGCPSSWNFEIFNSQLLQRHFLHYHITFCGDRSNCCRDIVFRVFQVKNVKKNYYLSANFSSKSVNHWSHDA